MITDFNGNITDYDYDDRGLENKRTEAVGTPKERAILTDWHSNHRLPTCQLEPQRTVILDYTAAGLLQARTEIDTSDITLFPDETSRTCAEIQARPDLSSLNQRAWSYTYDANNLLASVDGPRTDVSDITIYVNDPVNGNLLSVTNPLGQTTLMSNHGASGRVKRIEDPNGLITKLTYTPRGWLDSSEVGNDVDGYLLTDYDYDSVGQLIRVTQPDGSYLRFTYDAAHRLTDIHDQSGNHIHYTLDLMGNRTTTEVDDPLGTLIRIERSVYGQTNRLIQSLGADKGPDTFIINYDEYDGNGNLKRQSDAASNVTQHSYDALDRLISTIDALNGTTTYDYDTQDNLTGVTNPNGQTTTYVYDGLGNLLSQTSPDTGTTTYGYDSAGNLINQIDALNRTTTYSYDALNRLTQIGYHDNTSTVYRYDQGHNALGRLDTIADTSGTTAYTYDAQGRITAKTQSIGAINLVVAYRYNAAGQLDQITYPSGRVVNYSYTNGLVTAITVDGQPIAADIAYIPFGPPQSWTWGNNTVYSRSYELDGRLTSYGLGTARRDLSYDNTGNLASVVDPNDLSLQSAYDYDALYRLTDFNQTGASLFTAPPVVLGLIQDLTNETAAIPAQPSSPWLTTAVDAITSTNVQLALERSEVDDSRVTLPETIGYLAVEQGKLGTFVDSIGSIVQYETIATDAKILGCNDGCTGVFYAGNYATRPLAIATKASHIGNDGGWLRQCGIGKASVGLLIDEDTFLDGERSHAAEAASVMVFSQPFHAEFGGPNGTSWHLEAGSASLSPTDTAAVFTSVTFQQPFATTPIVLALPSGQDSAPAALRVRNITPIGFEIVQVEPAPNDGPHNSMKVHYIAIEPGIHQLPDGTWLDAGSVATTAVQDGVGVAGPESWHTQFFSPKAQAYNYNYDANGNRTGLIVNGHNHAYAIDAQSNRLTAVSGAQTTTYTHDAVGNTLSDDRHRYTYDAANRLSNIDSGAVSYAYNGLGQRVLKQRTVNDADYFAYDEQGQLIGEYDASGLARQETIWLGNLPIAVLKDGNVYYIHADHLNTPRAITDATDAVVWRWDFDPFGTTATNEDPDGDGALFSYNLRFPGQYYDSETGLHYNYHRYYDPATGKYITSDPIGLDGGLNTYLYANANPITFIDPLGLNAFASTTADMGGSFSGRDTCDCLAKAFLGIEDAAVLGGTAAAGALTGPFVNKPRGGIAGGGPAGNKTSVLSTAVHKLNLGSGKSSANRAARNVGRKIFTRVIPGAGTVLLVYDLATYLECLKECEGCEHGD